MDGIVRIVAGFLAGLFGIYSLLIIIRILMTWFSHVRSGRVVNFLTRITDPYLNWWRDKLGLRVGFLDLSPLAGMAVLSVLQTICSHISRQGRISLGIILGVCLSALWSAVSFLLGFCVIILVLRLIGYFINANIYNHFWRVVDTISRPLLYHVNRIIFGKRLVSYKVGIISAVVVLAAIWAGGRFAVQMLTGLLLNMT